MILFKIYQKILLAIKLTILSLFLGTSFCIAGLKSVTHNFDVISQALTEDLESSYEMFFLINTEEGPTKIGAFIPNQHMLIIKKQPGSQKIFTRNQVGQITGLVNGTIQLSDLIPQNVFGTQMPYAPGMPFDWNGLDVLPISSGTLYHMPTFSGIFQVNWSRSKAMYTNDESQPMSHSLYVGYYYHDSSLSPDQWTDDTREQVSYVAIHGTPQANWPLLGRTRASHGCARVRPPIMEAIYKVVENLPEKKVIDLDWNYELPQLKDNLVLKQKKPVLFLIFNGY